MTDDADSTDRDDHDSPWKEALEKYFEAFLALLFPAIHAEIDWSRGHRFLDKELQQIVRDAKIGRRYADKLVSVCRYDGQPAWVLVHVEVQGYVTSVERAGIAKGLQQGEQLGYQKGEAKPLLLLLTEKFGPASVDAQREHIGNADPQQLESWFQGVLTADTLEAIFRR
ncbi:hypothetical protein [Thiocapsa sp.]|uniref:hypothetical protein n=1 Tax=Thiocapsa sp. TaxID=2024551 RepID=UPI00359398C3